MIKLRTLRWGDSFGLSRWETEGWSRSRRDGRIRGQLEEKLEDINIVGSESGGKGSETREAGGLQELERQGKCCLLEPRRNQLLGHLKFSPGKLTLDF